MRVDAWPIVSFLLAGCALNIGSEPDQPTAVSAPSTLSGCLPLADSAAALTGRLALVTLPDQSLLAVAASATVDGETSSTGFDFDHTASACMTRSSALPARPILDLSPLAADAVGRPLASVTTSDTFLYFSDEHADGTAQNGIGVARWDATRGSFVALSSLWTADRPSYGSAAALVGDEVYVLGGLAARFLAADVYLARVPGARIAEPSAYEYWQGGGSYGLDPDSALPVVAGGTSPSLAFDAQRQRWLMLYAEPLARTVTVRAGLGVSGPWSRPYALGTCALPGVDPDAFCGDLALVPELAADGEIAFTQGVATFAPPPGASEQDFWTRLIRAPWPSGLP